MHFWLFFLLSPFLYSSLSSIPSGTRPRPRARVRSGRTRGQVSWVPAADATVTGPSLVRAPHAPLDNEQRRFDELQKEVISYGPCQFPTLGFVVDRYKRIQVRERARRRFPPLPAGPTGFSASSRVAGAGSDPTGPSR